MSEGFNLDELAINAIIREKSLKPFVKAKITQKFFKGKEIRTMFAWIFAYNERYGKVPSRRLLGEQFPHFSFTNPQEPSDFFANALVSRRTRAIMLNTMREIGEAMEAGSMKTAITKMATGVERIHLNANRTFDLSLKDDIADLFKRYIARRKNPYIAGIPFGFTPLDENTDGMLGGQFTLLFGDQGLGKSFLAVLFGVGALRAGYKVLYITKENKDTEITQRAASIIAHISPFRLRTGNLYPAEERRLVRCRRLLERLGERFIVSSQDEVDVEGEGGLGTAGVRQKIIEYQPDLVIVDGLYLLEDEDLVRGPEHITLRKIADRLKRMARKENVHIFAVTQANGEGANSERGGSGASHIAFSRGVAMACDMILNIYTNDELRAMNYMGIKLIKQREGPPVNFITTWDLNRCVFEVVENETSVDEPDSEIPS
jgi:replicative DNA helicase